MLHLGFGLVLESGLEGYSLGLRIKVGVRLDFQLQRTLLQKIVSISKTVLKNCTSYIVKDNGPFAFLPASLGLVQRCWEKTFIYSFPRLNATVQFPRVYPSVLSTYISEQASKHFQRWC